MFWQWINQSFNAIVNYTNRNANSPLTETQMGIAYGSATAAACFTAIKLKSFLAKRSGPFLQVNLKNLDFIIFIFNVFLIHFFFLIALYSICSSSCSKLRQHTLNETK